MLPAMGRFDGERLGQVPQRSRFSALAVVVDVEADQPGSGVDAVVPGDVSGAPLGVVVALLVPVLDVDEPLGTQPRLVQPVRYQTSQVPGSAGVGFFKPRSLFTNTVRF
jgi:hypothetical protein